MSDYVDQVIAGEQPQRAPDLIPANDAPVVLQFPATGHAIEGVAVTRQERGFYEDALAVLEAEEQRPEPSAEADAAWREAQKASVVLKDLAEMYGASIIRLAAILRRFEPGSFSERHDEIGGFLGSLYLDASVLMQDIARLAGRRVPNIQLLANLERASAPAADAASKPAWTE